MEVELQQVRWSRDLVSAFLRWCGSVDLQLSLGQLVAAPSVGVRASWGLVTTYVVWTGEVF